MAGKIDNHLIKVIKDLQGSIQELCKHYEWNQLPITDASPVLHRLCTKLEYLLQYDQKEKKSIFGSRKDYWDYFCTCLNSHKCGTDALKFIKHTTRLNTSMGKGRAFIRYCLVQQQLADTLQLCFLNQELASSEFKNPGRTSGMGGPSNNHFKGMFKKANNGSAKDPEHEKPVVTGEMKKSRKIIVQEIPSGPLAPHGALQSHGNLRDSHEPIQEMSTNSDGSSSVSGQQAQPEHDVKIFQHEGQNVELVSNLDQECNSSEQPRGKGQDDTQRCPEYVTTLAAGEKRETEVKVIAEQQSLIEKLSRDLKEKEHVIEQFNGLLKEKEKIHGEESSKLQQEISNLKEMQKKNEEQLNRVMQLEESNKFLNETVEEMDSVLDELKQVMVEKGQENKLLKKEQVEKVAATQQVHQEELEKLKLSLVEQQKEYDGMKCDADQRLKKVMEELRNKESILAGFQSNHELETDKRLAEMEALQSKLQSLESLNNSLENKNRESRRKVKDLEMTVISLQSELSRLQASEKQLQQSSVAILSPDGKELKLKADNDNVEEFLREVQVQNELINQGLERDELTQGEAVCSDSLAALKLEHQRALVKISDLGQQLAKYKEQEQTSKNPIEENINTAAKEMEDLQVMKDKLEEITQKLESSNAGKLEAERKLEVTVAQLYTLTAEQSSTENRMTELTDQQKVLAEERKTELVIPDRSQAEMVGLQPHKAEVRNSLQEVPEENISTQTELTSVLSALDESSQEVARVKKQMEELENNHRLEVQGMMERIETIQAEQGTLEQEKDELRKKVSILDEDLLQLKESAAKLEQANAKAHGEMERAQAEVEQLHAQMVQLTSEKVAIEEKVARMGQQQVNDEARKLENTEEGKEGARGQLSSLARANEELQAKLLAAQEQVSSLQQSREQASSDFDQEMAKKTVECDRQTETLNEALLIGRKDVQHKVEELKSKDAELLSLVESLAQARRAEEDLKETLKNTQEDAKIREEELHREIQDLSETVRSLKERTVELLREKDILWQKSDKLEFNQRQSDQKHLSRRDRFGSKK
ncbi:FYVE and coiled-coil domain-containing protein 1-like isoform X2 [Heterodontus francisci]|uniref:FYVE and coiled-coil domain-containing protein 1-like isoform X2 n=1 Tax=Heterodontus francisci TaxID=7792 RepID=UPI00355BA5FB